MLNVRVGGRRVSAGCEIRSMCAELVAGPTRVTLATKVPLSRAGAQLAVKVSVLHCMEAGQVLRLAGLPSGRLFR
jgi:hypothetical protein